MAVPKVMVAQRGTGSGTHLGVVARPPPTRYCQQRDRGAQRMKEISQAKPIMMPALLGYAWPGT